MGNVHVYLRVRIELLSLQIVGWFGYIALPLAIIFARKITYCIHALIDPFHIVISLSNHSSNEKSIKLFAYLLISYIAKRTGA